MGGQRGQARGLRVLAWGVLRLLDGDVLGGIWIAAIGWFLHSAASSTLAQVVFDTRLRTVRVEEVMRPDTTTVSPGLTVAELIDDVPAARQPPCRAGRA